jgi:cyclophilin family peptidyl-prolyl cis-trans isomerase
MKILLVLLICGSSARADLLANFSTSQGEISVKLLYNQAPQAVANFIILAQGSRPHIDAVSGKLSTKPFYSGEKFFRVVNDPGFKIIQTGSGNGTNAGGGPGYSFRDEFDPTLTHVPYVLSMANSGRNSNSSQIFFTGSLPQPSLNNVHTIFGSITDPASRAVIDAILAAGNNVTTITAVTFSRTDPAAIAFDEFAQNLPVCSGTPGSLAVVPITATTKATNYQLKTAVQPGSVIQAFRSSDLVSWVKLGELYQGTGVVGSSSIGLDAATLPKAFYNLPTVTYPDALAPASLANRTLIITYSGNQTLTFVFNAAGTGGTATTSLAPATLNPITSVDYRSAPHRANWLIVTAALGSTQIIGALNSQTPTEIIGTQTITQFNVPVGATGFSSSGSLTLTR